MWHPGANVCYVIDLHAQYLFFQPPPFIDCARPMVGLLLPAHPLTSQETEGYVYLVARVWRRTIDRGAQTLFGGQFNPVLVPVLVPALQWERT